MFIACIQICISLALYMTIVCIHIYTWSVQNKFGESRWIPLGHSELFYDIQAVFVTFKQGMLVFYMFLKYLMPRHSSSVCWYGDRATRIELRCLGAGLCQPSAWQSWCTSAWDRGACWWGQNQEDSWGFPIELKLLVIYAPIIYLRTAHIHEDILSFPRFYIRIWSSPLFSVDFFPRFAGRSWSQARLRLFATEDGIWGSVHHQRPWVYRGFYGI